MDDSKLEKWLDDYADRCNSDDAIEKPSQQQWDEDRDCWWYLAGRMDGAAELPKQAQAIVGDIEHTIDQIIDAVKREYCPAGTDKEDR